mmetsp:Transcript_34488/g.79719  ORF Transcript_34488/g.79719 Transcript_34488/m.79719 type:complete len:200 (-) Transcript_34488:632-1231(-)
MVRGQHAHSLQLLLSRLMDHRCYLCHTLAVLGADGYGISKTRPRRLLQEIEHGRFLARPGVPLQLVRQQAHRRTFPHGPSKETTGFQEIGGQPHAPVKHEQDQVRRRRGRRGLCRHGRLHRPPGDFHAVAPAAVPSLPAAAARRGAREGHHVQASSVVQNELDGSEASFAGPPVARGSRGGAHDSPSPKVGLRARVGGS